METIKVGDSEYKWQLVDGVNILVPITREPDIWDEVEKWVDDQVNSTMQYMQNKFTIKHGGDELVPFWDCRVDMNNNLVGGGISFANITTQYIRSPIFKSPTMRVGENKDMIAWLKKYTKITKVK